jgi:hypothetical protein
VVSVGNSRRHDAIPVSCTTRVLAGELSNFRAKPGRMSKSQVV